MISCLQRYEIAGFWEAAFGDRRSGGDGLCYGRKDSEKWDSDIIHVGYLDLLSVMHIEGLCDEYSYRTRMVSLLGLLEGLSSQLV